MPEIKHLEPLTDWITYTLKSSENVTEPHVAFRLRYLDALDVQDEIVRVGGWNLRSIRNLAMSAVAEWDLTRDGKPIPVTDETKARYLRPLLADSMPPTEEEIKRVEAKRAEAAKKGEDGEDEEPLSLPLASFIVRDAQNRELFLKN